MNSETPTKKTALTDCDRDRGALILNYLPAFAQITGLENGHWRAAVPADAETLAAYETMTGTNLSAPGESAGIEIAEAELDTCLHCHLNGEDTRLWTPLARWSIFGTFAMIFAFGVVRSSTVWRTRSPWIPLSRRAVDWVDSRYKVVEPLEKVLKKPVPRFATQWFYCLGGITLFLFIIQGITGIMLAFYYKPTPEAAYASIQYIETQVRFGSGIRAIHHWAANGMVLMCTAHLLRVFIMGAYKAPRELNWASGMLLFLLTMGFGLTGYLLPWDQRAYWATTVATEIAGGIPDIGNLALLFMRVGWGVTELTLSRFYALHILALPIITILTMGMHFLMICRQGMAQPL